MFESKEIFKESYERRLIEKYGRGVNGTTNQDRFIVLGEMIRDEVGRNWKKTKEKTAEQEKKQVYYFSMEFLLGRLMTNNLMNLGIYDMVKQALEELGVDLGDLEELEADAGLGNGGLGRLAACFIDSAVSNNYPVHGNTLRYEYGLFKQLIRDGEQIEVPDQWLSLGNVWETRKPRHAVDVAFYGRIEEEFNYDGRLIIRHKDAQHVRAVPYDVPVIGQETGMVNTLRLWSAEASSLFLPSPSQDFRQYITEVGEICQSVYPDDSNEHGRYLRLKQQYFFVSAGLQEIVKSHMKVYHTLDNLAEKVSIQLNDTHPILAIPELMRLMMDYYDYGWDKAYDIVCRTMNYTNHTVLQEALEKWPEEYIRNLLPRIYVIIREIDQRTKQLMRDRHLSNEVINRMAIMRDNTVFMANMGVHCCRIVNGVAQIHTDILKNDVLKDFYALYPEKFQNKTNGITHRRWLLYSNPELTQLLEDTIGPGFKEDISELRKLREFADDPEVQERFAQVKRQRKEILAKYIRNRVKIDVDPDSIFDIQAKRLHAYKRQTLDIFHVIYLYQRMKKDKNFRIMPRTFIFAAKAASSYRFAKDVIKLIHDVAKKVNADEETNKYLKVVFIPNYSVSIAEILMNAADVSEQISTAGKEASGTGNMKFMMNGAMTLGTLDGAVVEIDAHVGRENDVIFGNTVEELNELRTHYDAYQTASSDPALMEVLESLIDGSWNSDLNRFRGIYDELFNMNDEYFVFADFDAYCSAQEEIERRYRDQKGWRRSMLINIAESYFFSSDRTIKQYANEIWEIEPVEL